MHGGEVTRTTDRKRRLVHALVAIGLSVCIYGTAACGQIGDVFGNWDAGSPGDTKPSPSSAPQTPFTTTAAPTTSTAMGSGIRGTLDDWLSAVCEIGTYKADSPFQGAISAARCMAQSEHDKSAILILRFGSDFTMRNFLAMNDRYGFYTTGTDGSSVWLFGLPPTADREYLFPLQEYGFTIKSPPQR